MNNKPIIWILSDKKAKYQSQLLLASSLIDNYEIFFLITFKNKIKFFNYKNLKNISKKLFNSSKKSITKTHYRLLKKLFNNSPLGVIYYIIFILSNKYKVKKIMLKKMPKILILNGDRSGPGFETILLILAKKFNVKIVLPYLSVINTGKLVRINNPYTYKLNFLSKILMNSKYKFYANSSSYGFYTLSQYISLKFFNCITENPFSIGNHPTTSVLCLDSLITLNQISKNITKIEKVRYVGRYEYDYLAKHQDLKKENILLSLPQLFEHKIINWNSHIKFISHLVKTITDQYHLKISLHPKSEYHNYSFLEKKFNCIILREPIHKELVKSKLFICINSSIAIWSTLLGIKTIILDFFDLDMSMFNNLKSLIYVNSFNSLKAELRNKKSIDYTSDWKTLNKMELLNQKNEIKMDSILKSLLV